MKEKSQIISGVAAITGIFILIIDTKTAIQGAREGLQLCLQTVIPSLFPFFVISNMMVPFLHRSGLSRFLRGVGRLCGIPKGAEGLMMIGCISGYPVGAQSITQAHRGGMISEAQGKRMLGFCCNAGPSFIFGMAAALFPTAYMAWLLWAVHILCAVLIGFFLPSRSTETTAHDISPQGATWASCMNGGLRSMAMVCGWVILFRVVFVFMDRWFLWALPEMVSVVLTGFLELSNGCVQLDRIPDIGLRFCICAAFLGWGGVCVGMQTVSAVAGLGTGMYFLGKTLHGLMSFLVAYIFQRMLFPQQYRVHAGTAFDLICILGTVIVLIFLVNRKISSRNPESIRV